MLYSYKHHLCIQVPLSTAVIKKRFIDWISILALILWAGNIRFVYRRKLEVVWMVFYKINHASKFYYKDNNRKV